MIVTLSWRIKLAVVGGLVLTCASLLWPTVLTELMYKELKLSPGSKSFEHWVSTPVPMHIDIYFHNWTNPQDVNTDPPHFTQMGPYRFYEKRTKVKLAWNDNGTVSYRQTRHWHFDEYNSNGTLKDNVTTVNVIAATVAHKLRFGSRGTQKAASWGLTGLQYDVEMVKSVQELLFEGYSDRVLSILKYLPDYKKETTDKFGWFYSRNGSEDVDGVFNMDTGSKDLTQVGKIRRWNGNTQTNFFPGRCGEVAGTSGEVFPPWLTTEDRLGLFSGDLCRTIFLAYEEEHVVDGIRGFKYSGGTDFVDSGIVDPETACYRTGEPTPLGILNITECRKGAPIFVSYPHFYMGETSLLSQVTGLNPNKKEHSFEITVEPTLGVPLEIKGRFQVNIMLEPNRNYLLYRDLPQRLYLPLLWFDQRVTLTEAITEEVSLMVWLHNFSMNVAISFLVIGLVLAALGITCACKEVNKTQPNKLLHYTVHSLSTVSQSIATTARNSPRPSTRPSPSHSASPSPASSRKPSALCTVPNSHHLQYLPSTDQ